MTAGAAYAAPQAYGSQPLIRLSNGRPGIMVAINGYGPFPFLIDTATSHSVLSPHLRDVLKVPATGGPAYSVVTAAGSVKSHFHLVNEIAAAGVIVERLNAIVIDLPKELGAEGIIGADFLSNFTVDLDLAKRAMTLYPGGTVLQPTGFRRIAGTLNSAGFIVLPALVDGISASAVFDSGAVFTVVNFRLAAATQRVPKIIARNIQSKVIDAARQRNIAESVNFDRITMGPVLWSDRRVLVSEMHVFEQVGLDRSPCIFIGADFMVRRRVIIDYAQASLYLAP